MSFLKVYALILAGGEGIRFGGDVPKQFLDLNGRMVFEWAIDSFEVSDKVDEIFLIINSKYKHLAEEILKSGRYRKLRGFSIGGETRQDSVRIGLGLIEDDEGVVLIHDGVRPFVPLEDINRLVEELKDKKAVVLASPAKETMAIAFSSLIPVVESIPQRDKIFALQTPQGFRLSLIKEAHVKAWNEGFKGASDDCSLILRYFKDEKVYLISGSPYNIKITYPLDVEIARVLISKLRK